MYYYYCVSEQQMIAPLLDTAETSKCYFWCVVIANQKQVPEYAATQTQSAVFLYFLLIFGTKFGEYW